MKGKVMAKYDTVVFDLDGTTLDTLQDLADSVNFALKSCGFPERTYAHVRRAVGNGVRNLMSQCVPDGLSNPRFEECFEQFRKHYEKNLQNKTAPYPGIMALLQELHVKGYKMAIVSNKLDSAVKKLNKQYFGQMIPVAIGETEHLQRKPAPDSVFQALKELGSLPEKAVYVGDSEVDVLTAKNAGVPCIAVTWGFRDREELEDADFIIDEPARLLGILEMG
jgi:phosphoglycolate phosphatase